MRTERKISFKLRARYGKALSQEILPGDPEPVGVSLLLPVLVRRMVSHRPRPTAAARVAELTIPLKR